MHACTVVCAARYACVHFIRFHYRRDINKRGKIIKPITFPFVLDLYDYCTPELQSSLKANRHLLSLLTRLSAACCGATVVHSLRF